MGNRDEILLKGSVLGGFADSYTAAEKDLCRRIAVLLQRRHRGGFPARDDMDFYVRAAAGLYELAKNLHRLGAQARYAPPKSMDDWLEIMTGYRFNFISGPNDDVLEIKLGDR